MDGPAFSAPDSAFMARALQLAERGLYTTSPNPRVGCVLVKEGRVIGEGFHRRAGEAHAEVNALAAADNQAGNHIAGATAYVTLEPCSHTGRTPPCCDQLIAAGIRRVVAAMVDPNPLVSGRGLQRLQAAGIEAVCGLMETEAQALNPGFISRMQRGQPWVRLKAAASLDGKTALENGKSQWITGPQARLDGHRFRARACAILTGIGTVRADDPALTVRLPDYDNYGNCDETLRQPLKVIVDPRLEISPQARLLDRSPVVIATAANNDVDPAFSDKIRALHALGAEIWPLPVLDEEAGRLDLVQLLTRLAEQGINEVHVEAGSGLNGALAAADLVDEFLFYLAPALLGSPAQGIFNWPALDELAQRKRLNIIDIRMIGEDIRLIARPR